MINNKHLKSFKNKSCKITQFFNFINANHFYFQIGKLNMYCKRFFFKYNAKDTNNSTFKNINNILLFVHSTLLQKYNLRLFNYMHL